MWTGPSHGRLCNPQQAVPLTGDWGSWQAPEVSGYVSEGQPDALKVSSSVTVPAHAGGGQRHTAMAPRTCAPERPSAQRKPQPSPHASGA